MTPRSGHERPVRPALIALAAFGLAAALGGRPEGLAAEGGEFSQKVVMQNERVVARMNDYPAGSSSPEHAHAFPRVVVVVEGGSLEIRDASGKASTLSLKNGDIVWRPPEKHTVTNTGSTRVRLIEVDVLDCPEH